MTRSQLTREELQHLAGGFLTEHGCQMGDRIPIARVEAFLVEFFNEIEGKLDDPTWGWGPHP